MTRWPWRVFDWVQGVLLSAWRCGRAIPAVVSALFRPIFRRHYCYCLNDREITFTDFFYSSLYSHRHHYLVYEKLCFPDFAYDVSLLDLCSIGYRRLKVPFLFSVQPGMSLPRLMNSPSTLTRALSGLWMPS